MAAQSHYLPALHKLFRTRPVALLSDLRKALQTPSRTTVFRVLSSVGYLASYSHAGRYYTLKRIPQFDPRGLWHYRQIGFSSQRTLRATLVHLVETSPAGQTHEELQDVLLLRVHNTLRLLVRARELQRRLFQDVYVYLSAKPKPASRQWAESWLRSEEHTSELQSLAYLVCRLLLEKKKKIIHTLHIKTVII